MYHYYRVSPVAFPSMRDQQAVVDLIYESYPTVSDEPHPFGGMEIVTKSPITDEDKKTLGILG